MNPVPLDERTWTTFNYVAYWISDATNIATWETASSMLAIGLSWLVVSSNMRNGYGKYQPHRRQALPAIALGNTIMGIVMVLNGPEHY